MQLEVSNALVDLWSRRHAPVDHDVPRALYLARSLEDRPDAPQHLLGFAWTVIDEMLRAAEWSLPDTEGLVRCRSAAASIAHSTALLLDDVETAVAGASSPPLILGALGASKSLFGRWDLMPARGALLVSLDDACDDCGPLVSATPDSHGVRWASPGSSHRMLEKSSRLAELGGVAVRVPSPPLIAARIGDSPPTAFDLSLFLFCAAAHAASTSNQWSAVRPLAQSFGRGAAVREAVVRLRLEDWLEVRIPATSKLSVRIRQIVRPALAARNLFFT